MSINKLGLNYRDRNGVYGRIKKLERENAPKDWTGYYGIFSSADNCFIQNIQEESPLDAILKLVEKTGYYDPYTRAKVKRIKAIYADDFRNGIKDKNIDVDKYNEERKQMRAERHEKLLGSKSKKEVL